LVADLKKNGQGRKEFAKNQEEGKGVPQVGGIHPTRASNERGGDGIV